MAHPILNCRYGFRVNISADDVVFVLHLGYSKVPDPEADVFNLHPPSLSAYNS